MFDFDRQVDRHGTCASQGDPVAAADLLPFTRQDMDMEAAPCIRATLANRLAHGLLSDSRWDQHDFKAAISGWFERRHQARLDPAMLVYGPSVIYIIAQLVSLWSQAGEGVLLHTPAHDGLGKMLVANDRQPMACPLIKCSGEYHIDWPTFERQAARPDCRILLLCSPHDPTGRVWTRQELARMADICQRHGIRVISHDIYMDIASPPYLPWSEVALDQGWALVSTCSTSFNVAGLGGAYGVIADTATRSHYLQRLEAVHGLAAPPIFGILAHISAYRDGDDWLDALTVYLHNNLVRVADRLNPLFPAIDYRVPEGSYLAWIDLRPLAIDMAALQTLLVEKYQVAIMGGETYGPEGEGFICLNVGCSRQKLDRGLDALIGALVALAEPCLGC